MCSRPGVLGFKDGVIIQLLNIKGWMMVLLMFSLFSEPALQSYGNGAVWYLVVMLALLNVSTHLLWIGAGEVITRLVAKKSNQKIQGYMYFISLVTVAGWLFVDNPYWSQ